MTSPAVETFLTASDLLHLSEDEAARAVRKHLQQEGIPLRISFGLHNIKPTHGVLVFEDCFKTDSVRVRWYPNAIAQGAPGTTAYQQVVAAWNAQADETNQWDALGEDEKIEWALQCRDQIRGVTKMMRDDDAASEAIAQAAGGAA